MLEFWRLARQSLAARVVCVEGQITRAAVTAPMAVYSAPMAVFGRGSSSYVFLQHGSYQLVSPDEQPLVESGKVMLYRGIGAEAQYRFHQADLHSSAFAAFWQRYSLVQAEVLSDSVQSFKSIHDRTKRCETSHLQDGTWFTNDVARKHQLDVSDGGAVETLWRAAHQSFALERWVAANKFGPNYVVHTTPLDNIRITTFFAGEREARIIDPRRLEIVELHGCRVAE